jgi:hypothetical protein
VVLGYDISSVPAGALGAERTAGRGSPVFVKLAPNRDGFYEAISVHAAPVDVASPEVLIRGHVVSGVNCGKDSCSFASRLQVRYGIENYFVATLFRSVVRFYDISSVPAGAASLLLRN